jgi:hypothetical protein
VNAGAVATPLAFVFAVFTPPANAPLAPLPGEANVTVAPLSGLLLLSFTVACSAVPNVVVIVALWGVPAVAVMLGPIAAGTRISAILKLYLSPVGDVSLMVTLLPLSGVALVCLWTQ